MIYIIEKLCGQTHGNRVEIGRKDQEFLPDTLRRGRLFSPEGEFEVSDNQVYF